MAVLHNLSGKKFLTIILGLLSVFTLNASTNLKIFSQESDNFRKEEKEKRKEFTLPYNLCSEKFHEKSNVKKLASDNEQQVYLFYSGNIISKNIDTNNTNWESSIGSENIFEVLFDEKYIYLKLEIGNEIKIKKISKLTGITIEETPSLTKKEESNENLLKYEHLIKNPSSLLIKDKVFFLGNNFGDIVSLENISEKTIWKGKTGGKITSIIPIGENKILVNSLDNFLYLFSNKNGNLIWKKRMPDRIYKKPKIYQDEILLITNSADSSVFLIEIRSGKTANLISLPENVGEISDSILIKDKLIISTDKGVFAYNQGSC